MLLVTNLTTTKWYKKNLKTDWNPVKWVLIWEYLPRAIQWIPTWQGLDGFQQSLRPCASAESSPSIEKVKHIVAASGWNRNVHLSCQCFYDKVKTPCLGLRFFSLLPFPASWVLVHISCGGEVRGTGGERWISLECPLYAVLVAFWSLNPCELK